MAVQLVNLLRHPIRVDLRGGGVLVVHPGERSAALREELLYDNPYLPEWERAGWVTRVPARMQEALDAEVAAKAPAAVKAIVPKVAKRAKNAKRAKRAKRAKGAKKRTVARKRRT